MNTTLPTPLENPLSAGWRAARANFRPGLCLQLVMLLVVVAYFRAPWAKPWFDHLASLKANGGLLFSATASAIAGAVLPEGLAVIFFQCGQATRRNLENVGFGVVFWAFAGGCVDLLYRGQNLWFGTEPSPLVIAKKVAVDQFIYSALFAAPFAAGCYAWKNQRYRTSNLGRLFTREFYVRHVLPTTFANWGFWGPAVTLIYCLPPLLQFPLFSLALTFWALILAYINSGDVPANDATAAQRDKLPVTIL